MPDSEVKLASTEDHRLHPGDRGLFWALIILMLSLFALAIGFFGDQGNGGLATTSTPDPSPTESQPARLYTVSYKAGVFSPTNLRIHAGDTVRFHNDSLLPIHVRSTDYVGFDSIADIPGGSNFSFTLAAKGTFVYRNEHNINETGTIIVR